MPLHSTRKAPERILVFGNPGTGKSSGIIDVAKWSQRTGSESRFFYLDSDLSVEAMLAGDALDNLEVFTAFDWSDFTDFRDTVFRQAKPGDWVVIDFISTAWSAVQEHFVREVFHQDLDQYFLQARKSLKKDATSLSALEGWVDWNVINPMYARWANDILLRGQKQNGYHVWATAQADQLSSGNRPTEDASVRSLLLPFGVKPRGQKHLLYPFHTALISEWEQRSDTYLLNTVKDRRRTKLTAHPVSTLVKGEPHCTFTAEYLKKVAGWELA